MAKKQFKTESKKILDLMVNSIYTHKEIFLRELISNASDAIDKLYFRSLTDPSVNLSKEDYEIRISLDKENRILTISDNGCGMTEEELDKNLGTIARSGSLDFKTALKEGDHSDVDIIGQFGVGFYSAFMVSDRVTVISKAFGNENANVWEASGADGYTIKNGSRETAGTTVELHLKEDSEDEKYSEFLDEWKIKELVHKYSDYVRYPIRMLVEHSKKKEDSEEYETVKEDETLNSMIPIWKKDPSEVSEGLNMTFVGINEHITFILVLTLIAVLSKLIGGGLGAKLSGFSWSSATIIGAGLVSRGEMALIISKLGLDSSLLSNEYYSSIIMVIILIFLL